MKLKDLLGASPEALGKAAAKVADNCNKSGKLHDKLHKPDKAAASVFAWKQGVADLTGGFVHLTREDAGKLSVLTKGCPKGKAVEVIEFVLADWIYFAIKRRRAC